MFRLCSIAGIGAGMGGIAWIGIEAKELRAALWIRRIPRDECTDLADDVHYMGNVVADERNKRAAHEAKRKG